MKASQKKLKNAENTREDDVCLPEEAPPSKPIRSDCPLDKDGLGRGSWGLLHTMAAKYPDKPSPNQRKDMCDLMKIISRMYPCETCAEDLREDLVKHPPRVESQEALSKWLCEVHNRINVRLDKPKFDCSKVNERWRDGWKDGSCDY